MYFTDVRILSASSVKPEVLSSNTGRTINLLTKLFRSWIGIDVKDCDLK
jgi:hypothetical protein